MGPSRTCPETGKRICRHWECDNRVKPPRRTWCSKECVHDALMQANPGYAREQVWNRDKGVCAQCGTDTDQIRRDRARLRSWTSYKETRKRIAKRFNTDPNGLQKAIDWEYWHACETMRERYKQQGKRPPYHWKRTEPPLTRAMTPERAIHIARFVRRLERLATAWKKAHDRRLRDQGYDLSRRHFWDMDHIEEVIRGGSYRIENLQTLCQPCHKRKTARLAAELAAERKREKERSHGQEQLEF